MDSVYGARKQMNGVWVIRNRLNIPFFFQIWTVKRVCVWVVWWYWCNRCVSRVPLHIRIVYCSIPALVLKRSKRMGTFNSCTRDSRFVLRAAAHGKTFNRFSSWSTKWVKLSLLGEPFHADFFILYFVGISNRMLGQFNCCNAQYLEFVAETFEHSRSTWRNY